MSIKKFDTNTPFERIWEYYHKQRALTDKPMLLHFRIATHGSINIKNVHPFMVNPKLAFAHNGVLTGFGSKTYKQEVSDSIDFMKKVLRKLPDGFYLHEGTIEALGAIIGSSKFAFLDVDGQYNIVNPQHGVWDEGDWFSNTGFRTVGYRYKKNESTSGSRYYGCGFGDSCDDSYSDHDDRSRRSNNTSGNGNSNSNTAIHSSSATGKNNKKLTKWVVDPISHDLLTAKDFLAKYKNKDEKKEVPAPQPTVEAETSEDVDAVLKAGWTQEDTEWFNHIFNNGPLPKEARSGTSKSIGDNLIQKLSNLNEYIKGIVEAGEEMDPDTQAKYAAILDMIEECSKERQNGELMTFLTLLGGGTISDQTEMFKDVDTIADGDYSIETDIDDDAPLPAKDQITEELEETERQYMNSLKKHERENADTQS